jgi:arylsulfatase A-like enzyme
MPVILSIAMAILCMYGAIVSAIQGSQSTGSAGPTQPDIVVVMADDLGAISDSSGTLDERILSRLPNISSLFLSGNALRFDQYYGQTPLCCPGRAQFMSGQYVEHNGVNKNDPRLFNPTYTIATALHAAGYQTILVGKYFNNVNWLTDKTPPGWDKIAMFSTSNGNSSSTWYVQGRYKTAGFVDRFMADKSLAWLRQVPSGQPVYLEITPHAPHFGSGQKMTPWNPDVEAKYLNDQRCSGIAPWEPPTYSYALQPNGYPLDKVCRSLLTTDDAVGAIRAEMQAQGRNPIYVFTGDNGMSWGADGFPLKNVPQSNKLPLYMVGPGVMPGSTSALVENIDLAPTLVNMAGGTMPKADGQSFASVVLGQSTTFHDWIYESHPLGGFSGLKSFGNTGGWWAIKTPQWRLVEWRKWRGEALYDEVNDPWETTNLASQYPDIVAQLKALKPI